MNIVHKSSAGRVLDTLTFVLSAETPDRMGDVIVQKGWKLDNFKKNPVALMSHRQGDMPVGIWKNLRIVNDALLGDLTLVAKGISQTADLARGLIEEGILKAVSVGFVGLKAEPMQPRGMKYFESELLEVSLVSVPMHPRAVMVAKSLNMTDEEMKEFFTTEPVGENGGIVTKSAEEQSLRYQAAHKRGIYALINATRAQRARGEL
jgi:hypothetical protein